MARTVAVTLGTAATAAPVVTSTRGTTVGSQSYTVPVGAVFAATSGSDTTGVGTESAPYATVGRAISACPAGGTVVVRGGSYHEGSAHVSAAARVGIAISRAMTVQAYPGEAVWLDGSSVQSGWTQDGAVWRKSIAMTFDRSPTGSRGAADGTTVGWQWVDPAYPCAPWPEMVFVNGTALEQVSTLAAVGPGKFFVEGSYTGTGTAVYEFTSTAYVIGDDPTGKEVRVSDLVTCMGLLAADVTVRGLGVRRYAASVWDYGVIKVNRARGILEHVVVEDCSGRGVYFDGSAGGHVGGRMTNCTVQRCGLLGVGGNKADDAVLDRCRFVYNTTGLFNVAPVSGGVKWTHALNFTTDDCEISDNYRHGWWADESVTGILVRRCDVQRNGGHGIIPEISEAAVIVDCVATDNALAGIYVSGVNNSRVWCNTVARNGSGATGQGGLYLYQDTRRPATFPSGMDSRFDLAWHQANCSWDIRAFESCNNISDEPVTTGSAFKVSDPGLTQSGWNGMGVAADGNLYCQRAANVPQMFFTATTDTSVPIAWASFAPYAAHVSPQEGSSVENRGTGWCVLDAYDRLSPQGAAVASGVPIPADIAALLGVATGSTQVGAIR